MVDGHHALEDFPGDTEPLDILEPLLVIREGGLDDLDEPVRERTVSAAKGERVCWRLAVRIMG
jgi:hypothetical protein